MQQPIRVLLVDDHAVVRKGYHHLLQASGIEVAAEADSGEDAYRLYAELLPDVVIMDLSMPGMGGLETLRRIISRDSNARILIFSMHDDAIFPTRALMSGAMGYVSKASAPEVLVEAVQSLARNRNYVSHDIAQQVAMQKVHGDDPLKKLSPREFEVFNMLAQGQSLDGIASTLCLDYKTVANVQSRLRTKLNVEGTAQLMLQAFRLGLMKK